MAHPKNKVGVGMVTYGPQEPSWWLPMLEEFANFHKHGIEFDQIYWQGTSDIATNRNTVAQDFLDKNTSDWLWWIDSDNPPAIGTLYRLLQLGEPAVSGLYYSGREYDQVTPIAYVRNPKSGGYAPIPVNKKHGEQATGEILPVDAVGMGCFLTHRSVYEKILEEYTYLQRGTSGGCLPIRKENIRGKEITKEVVKHPYAGTVKDGIFYEPVVVPQFAQKKFPFFYSQHNRTEDMPFCEMLRGSGTTIWVDTTCEVGHVKHDVISGGNYRNWAGRPSDDIEEVEYVEGY
jgi:hypothetical protein